MPTEITFHPATLARPVEIDRSGERSANANNGRVATSADTASSRYGNGLPATAGESLGGTNAIVASSAEATRGELAHNFDTERNTTEQAASLLAARAGEQVSDPSVSLAGRQREAILQLLR
jgi:hypothetical protein